MRHTPYFISPTSSDITAFADIYQSFEEVLKSFAIMDTSGEHKQIASTDESVQIYLYEGIYLYVIREDNPLFAWSALYDDITMILSTEEVNKVEDYVHRRFLAYQMEQPKWMRDYLAKQKR